MSTPSGVMAGIREIVAAVSGLHEAVVPWTLDTYPSSDEGGGFLLLPTSDAGGVPTSSGLPTTLDFDLMLPWRLTGDASGQAAALADKVHAVRSALLVAVDNARIVFGPTTYTVASEGHVLVATLTIHATTLLD